MVRGLDLFRARFADHTAGLVLIGGAACHEWFANDGLEFRATKDLDVVLIVEVLDRALVASLRQFVADGGYAIKERSSGSPELHRFSKPADPAFPHMVELFSRKPERLDLWDEQAVVPMAVDGAAASLSAILLDDAYYALIQEQAQIQDGLRLATPTALVPLKARAWLDLTRRQADGDPVDQKDINKHRSDVFRLAVGLPGEPGPVLPDSIRDDVHRFLLAFPEHSPEWKSILAALEVTFRAQRFKPGDLRRAVEVFFRVG